LLLLLLLAVLVAGVVAVDDNDWVPFPPSAGVAAAGAPAAVVTFPFISDCGGDDGSSGTGTGTEPLPGSDNGIGLSASRSHLQIISSSCSELAFISLSRNELTCVLARSWMNASKKRISSGIHIDISPHITSIRLAPD